ncbi:MAG: recombinase family protein [Firmicutes bacterium]|nr:recombinase family protein [Bacillota bacterium]
MEQQDFSAKSKTTESTVFNRQYRAALYLRFSRDDGKTADNSSIETQKMMLERYCEENGYTVHDVYKDDGYTGLNFNRPDFQRLLADIESGKVNLVITKDLSRLGRDYIQTGYYTEIFFPERSVRYIAINDGVDTLKADNDIAPFRNILNDMYSKDISRKVKSAKRQRAMKGYFINPQAPYGYRKDPANKNRLIIDPDAAETVRLIFALALEGSGAVLIAKALTDRRILIPSALKTQQGLRGFGHFDNGKDNYVYKWKYTTVRQILRDRVYVGDMVNRKYETPNYKVKKLVAVAKELQIVVRDTHEPLVSRDDFDRVQRLIDARHTPQKHITDNIFRGILFCAECGRRMSLSTQRTKAKGATFAYKSFYRCMNHYQNPDECAHYNHVYYADIYAQVWKEVKGMMSTVLSDDGLLETVLKRSKGMKTRHAQTAAEKGKIEKRLSALAAIVRRLYEDYAADALDGDNYKSMLADYQREQQQLKARLADIESELGKADDIEEGFKQLKAFAAAYFECAELTAEMVKLLIERIEISHPETVNGIPTRTLNIVYRFIKSSINQ